MPVRPRSGRIRKRSAMQRSIRVALGSPRGSRAADRGRRLWRRRRGVGRCLYGRVIGGVRRGDCHLGDRELRRPPVRHLQTSRPRPRSCRRRQRVPRRAIAGDARHGRAAWIAPATSTLRPRRSVSTTVRSTEETGPKARSTRGRRRGLHRLRRRRADAGIINDPAGYPDDHADVSSSERGGRRGQHLDRLARHRVPPVGPGPPVDRPGRRPFTDYTTAAERRPPRRVPRVGHRPPHRRHDQR